MAFQKVATLEELWAGEMISRVVGGQKLVLLNIDNAVYVYDDCCAHKGVRLSLGHLKGKTLTCFAHHWEYDMSAGRGINPASARLKAFPVKVEDGTIFVDLEQTGEEAVHKG